MFELLDVAKMFIDSALRPDATVCDFTMGNGHDTEYLCRRVPNGKVYAFDIQESAVRNTTERLAQAGLTNAVLIHDSHANCEQYIHEPIDAGLFNLGYLPGSGDKTVHTMRESTRVAVESAIRLLKKGGILAISVYPGHEEGRLEGKMLIDLLAKNYDKKYYCITLFRLINSPDAPFVIAVEKYDK